MRTPRTRSGFSIIELLVVIAVLGILTALIATSYGITRRNSRDARRKSDVTAYAAAFQQHLSLRGSLFVEGGTGAGSLSYGRMNFKSGTESGLTYGATSIAEQLRSLGYIKDPAIDPHGSTEKGYPDYVFVRCLETKHNFQSLNRTGDGGAIWAKLESPGRLTEVDLSNTQSACGNGKATSRFSFGYTANVANEDSALFPSPTGTDYEKNNGYYAASVGKTY